MSAWATLAVPFVGALHAFVHTMGYGVGDVRSPGWRRATLADAGRVALLAFVFYGAVTLLLCASLVA